MLIQPAIQKYLSCQLAVVVAFVFGSAAANRLRYDSDIDIAMLFEPDQLPDDTAILALRSDLEQIVQRDVDLVVLNQAPTILAFQVTKTGQLVYCRDRRALDQFIVRLITDYTDLKITRRPIEQAVIRRRIW